MSACPNCGHVNEDDAKYCSQCATSLAEPRPHASVERKVVTVLFADLVGFTARSEELDPEDVQAVLAPYHARVREELERWGGTVEKFIGDAVMALFGAPITREDDPERAVCAALAIRDWIADEGTLQVRLAVNTGEALVNLGARPQAGEGMAAGDVVNTTARLQTAAPVNGILVGESTHRATGHTIDYVERPPVEAKGKAQPVRVWEVVQARASFGVDLAPRERTPLVGRERELRQLADALERVRQQRSPELITVVGVPGIGKSRLVGELFATIESGRQLTYWRQGRSLPYGGGISYLALGEMVKAHAGILETDSEEQTETKLRRVVERLTKEDARWVLSHVRPLVGQTRVATSGSPEEAFAAWRRFFEGLADQYPLALVFEDIQWADDGVLDFIEHLADWVHDVPMLILCTARLELQQKEFVQRARRSSVENETEFRLQARPPTWRRIRPDTTHGARAEAHRCRALDRVSGPSGRPCRDARPPLQERAGACPRFRKRHCRARDANATGIARRRRSRCGAECSRPGRAVLRRRARAGAGCRAHAGRAPPTVRSRPVPARRGRRRRARRGTRGTDRGR